MSGCGQEANGWVVLQRERERRADFDGLRQNMRAPSYEFFMWLIMSNEIVFSHNLLLGTSIKYNLSQLLM